MLSGFISNKYLTNCLTVTNLELPAVMVDIMQLSAVTVNNMELPAVMLNKNYLPTVTVSLTLLDCHLIGSAFLSSAAKVHDTMAKTATYRLSVFIFDSVEITNNKPSID